MRKDVVNAKVLQGVLGAAEESGALPDPGEVAHLPLSRNASGAQFMLMQDQALRDKLCLLVFCGLSQRRIAERLGVDKNTVLRAIKSEEFQVEYARQRDVLLAKVNDHVIARLDEIALECLELKISILRASGGMAKRVKPHLQNQVANELLELWNNTKRDRKGGGLPDEFKAVWERAMQRRLPDGSTVTEKVTFSGSPGPDVRGGFVAGTGGPAATVDGDAGADHRTSGAPQNARGVLGDGSDRADGAGDSGPRTEGDRASEAGDSGGDSAARDTSGRFGATE